MSEEPRPSSRGPRDQFDALYVARCQTCKTTRFASSDEVSVLATVASDGHWDLLERMGTLSSCCRGDSVVELLVCPECARVPGPLHAGSYDERLPNQDCSRCGRPYRGLR